MTVQTIRLAVLSCFALWAPLASAQEVGVFELHFDADAFGTQDSSGFQGEVFVALSKSGEPREEMHGWFGAPPVMRFELPQAKKGAVIRVSLADALAAYPFEWTEELNHEWKVQAIARVSRTARQAGLGAGDVHSVVKDIQFVASAEGVVTLHLDQLVEAAPFQETDRIRLFEFVSPSLSKFHGFDYTMRAGVLLPRDYMPGSNYPVVYSVTGFGGSHRGIGRWAGRIQEGGPLNDCILVIPDANNRFGHSVFCDSDSIGPWGHALVNELIPALEKEYGGAGADFRYVTGVSSGGWSSLWLQVTYPDQFNGCWSHVPDPIDFHDFQQINLYEPLEDGSPRNMYTDEAGAPRGLARRQGKVLLTYEEFARREDVLNPGGQIRSFDATFSPLAADGSPERVFDVETGEINHEAAQAWRKYDLSNTLLTRWEELRPLLKGKIHVYAGGEDTFYLEGAVERFQRLAREAGLLEDMHIEVVPGMPHRQHREGHEDMLRTIREHLLAPLED